MFGHTHSDIFKSVLSFETNQPVGVLTVCGSMTTWGGLNPSFCVYELDRETLLPVKRQTWSFDIAASNESDVPNWSLFTDWTEVYEMDDLSPSSYFDLAMRFLVDADLTAEYRRRQGRHLTGGSCDDGCMKSTNCDSLYFDLYLNS